MTACGAEDRRRDGPPVLMASRALPVTSQGTVKVAWYFDLADGWHLYWPGRNDSGFPPSLKLDLPAGWSARPLRWPVPTRHVLPGDLLDHVYDLPLLVLEQELVPPDPVAAAGQEISARWRWLACRDECVPGDTTLTVTVPYRLEAAASAPPGAAPIYPAPLPADSYTTAWEGETLVVRAAGARRLRFFPFDDCGRLADLLADGEAQGDLLRLRCVPAEDAVGPVRGLLQVETDNDVLTGPFDVPAVTHTMTGAQDAPVTTRHPDGGSP